jgi:hypothetical protein
MPSFKEVEAGGIFLESCAWIRKTRRSNKKGSGPKAGFCFAREETSSARVSETRTALT